MNFDDFKIYLPKFLSAESDKELFEGLKSFPNNLDSRMYSNYLEDTPIIYQGDGIKDLLVINLPESEMRPTPSIILSNTCDIDLENQRLFSSQVVYAPIFNLEKYQNAILSKGNKSAKQIDSHIDSVRRQEITQIFYLPKLDGKIDESIVFLDRVLNLPNKYISRQNLTDSRLFTLSNYGAYIFILKLSIHFTRIKDKVDRKSL